MKISERGKKLIKSYEEPVRRYSGLNQNQFDALV